jgi:transposase-like protein
MIIRLLGVNVKTYIENFSKVLVIVDRICPLCRGDCIRHGFYERYVIVGQESLIIIILRLKCKGCGKTHAVIPEFLRPYSPYQQDIREKAMKLIYQGMARAETARKMGLSRELLRWWRKAFEQRAPEVVLAIQSMFHEIVIEAARTWWEWLKGLVEKLCNMAGMILIQANILANQSGLRVWV